MSYPLIEIRRALVFYLLCIQGEAPVDLTVTKMKKKRSPEYLTEKFLMAKGHPVPEQMLHASLLPHLWSMLDMWNEMTDEYKKEMEKYFPGLGQLKRGDWVYGGDE